MIGRATSVGAALRTRQRGFMLNPYRFGAGGGSLPLDSYTSGLWTACALTKLLTSYAGSAIRVRRSSDNTEQDIGFDATGALDTTALASFVGANSAYIVKWYDQSGGGNDLSQATTARQARIVNAGTYDGKAVLDGVDDSWYSPNSGTPVGMTLHFKGKVRSTPTNYYRLFEFNAPYTLNGASATCYYRTASGPGSLRIGFQVGMCSGSSLWINSFSQQPNNDVWTLRLDRAGSTGAALFISGASTVASGSSAAGGAGYTVGSSFTSGAWNIGGNGGNGVPMDLYNCAIYETAQSNVTIAAVSAALS